MKKYGSYISILSVFLFLACSEYAILDSKPGEAIKPVTNLTHSISGNEAVLTWDLPSDFPDDIVEPVSIFVRITIDGQSGGTVTLANAPETYVFPNYDASRSYKFTVKVMASVDTDQPAVSNLRYSQGQTITF
jgi:hypothetical protein